GWGYKTLDIICFTHYHGDHVTGLPGLLLTLGNAGREEPLTIIGPPGLKRIVDGLTVVCRDITFPLNLIELPYEKSEVVVGEFHISALPVPHKVPCFGYVIENKRQPKFVVEKARENEVPQKLWKKLQLGESVQEQNKLYTPDMVLGEDRKGIKVAYCTDCRPTEDMAHFVKDSDLFICEGMYIEDEIEQVKKYKHMLSSEAAQIAKKAAVKELWLTHFSPAVPNSKIDATAICEIFPNTIAGTDRMTTTIGFDD
ncbi:MAG: ribonuclease Z, partial [Niameybacter sp.]